MGKFRIIPREISHTGAVHSLIGKRVCRGPDWEYHDDQDNGGRSAGTITKIAPSSCPEAVRFMVKWDFDGDVNGYDFGPKTYDLDLIDESAVDVSFAGDFPDRATPAPKFLPRAAVDAMPRAKLVGRKVVRGPDWKWGDQDNGGSAGTIINADHGANDVRVRWDFNGSQNTYWLHKNQHDLKILYDKDIDGAKTEYGESRVVDTKQHIGRVPTKDWERPNTLVKALFLEE